MARIHKKTIFQTNLDTLWDIITNNNDYSWRSNIKEIKIINDKKFIEIDSDDVETEFTIITSDKNKKYEIDYENNNLKGHWVGLFYLTSQGAELDMVEDVESKKPLLSISVSKTLKRMREIYIEDIRRAIVSKMKAK